MSILLPEKQFMKHRLDQCGNQKGRCRLLKPLPSGFVLLSSVYNSPYEHPAFFRARLSMPGCGYGKIDNFSVLGAWKLVGT